MNRSIQFGAIASLMMLITVPLPTKASNSQPSSQGAAYTTRVNDELNDETQPYNAVVEQGQQQLDAQDYQGSLTMFERAILLYPDEPRLLVGKGESLYGLNRFEEAATAFKTATELAPDYLYAWVWLGNAYDDGQQLDLALDAYSAASRLDETHPMPYYHRGIALWYADRNAEAEADFRKTIEIIPEFPNGWMWLGRSLGQQSQYESALAAFEQALALEPTHQGALFGQARSLLELDRFDESVAAFDDYLLQDAESEPAWFYRGNGLLSLGQDADALVSYDRSLALLPDNEGSLYNKGLALTNLERYDEAIASFEQVVALNPKNADALEQIEALKRLRAQKKQAVS